MIACAARPEADPERPAPEVRVASCPSGELPRVDGTCSAVGAGPPPSAPSCVDGAIAIPGDAACRPISTCETARYRRGAFAQHRHVDQAADPATADGSEAHPYPTIQRAIDAAPAGAAITVTDGRYEEDLVIKRPTTILGRCAARVTIAGRATYAIDVSSDLDLRDVSVTGERVGLGVASGKVTLTHVWIHDTGDRGVDVEDFADAAELLMRASIVERAHDIGVFASGATVTLEESVVRGTRKPLGATTAWGQGVQARAGEKSGTPSTVTLRKSVVEDNVVYGVLAVDSRAHLEDSIVRGTAASAASPAAGFTVHKQLGEPGLAVRVTRSMFSEHAGAGLDLADAEVFLEDVTVRAVSGGAATAILLERSTGSASRLTIETIVGNGLTIKGSKVSIASARLRDIRSAADDRNGAGVVVDAGLDGPSSVSLADVLVERAHVSGLLVFGSNVDAGDVAILGTQPTSLGTLGDGISVLTRAYEGGKFFDVGRLTLARAVVRDNARAGVVLFGATARISNAVLCNGIDLDVERALGAHEGVEISHDFALEDGGGNACGCASPVACVAKTSGLKPVAR